MRTVFFTNLLMKAAIIHFFHAMPMAASGIGHLVTDNGILAACKQCGQQGNGKEQQAAYLR